MAARSKKKPAKKRRAESGISVKRTPSMVHPYPPMEERKIKPYPDREQKRVEIETKTYEYHFPFNYANIRHCAFCNDPAPHGIEMNPVNSVDSRTNDDVAADYFEITEEQPIVRVVVIGSACTPPGYVQLEADPSEGFRRPDEPDFIMPVRMRAENLWGMHLRGDQWMKSGGTRGDPLPEHYVKNWPYCHVKDFPERYSLTGVTYENVPLAGMSCAVFEIPASDRVRIMGGSVMPGWTADRAPSDGHYSFRIFRVTVLTRYEETG